MMLSAARAPGLSAVGSRGGLAGDEIEIILDRWKIICPCFVDRCRITFGWEVGEDGTLVQVPEQQATIQQILALRREGLSLRSITIRIGGPISHVTVGSVIKNAMRVVS
jgi:hypothetical protein